jgi:hypothetical protein
MLLTILIGYSACFSFVWIEINLVNLSFVIGTIGLVLIHTRFVWREVFRETVYIRSKCVGFHELFAMTMVAIGLFIISDSIDRREKL